MISSPCQPSISMPKLGHDHQFFDSPSALAMIYWSRCREFARWSGSVASGCARGAKPWRGVRVAEGARLESVFTSNRDVGSNPTLSASLT